MSEEVGRLSLLLVGEGDAPFQWVRPFDPDLIQKLEKQVLRVPPRSLGVCTALMNLTPSRVRDGARPTRTDAPHR